MSEDDADPELLWVHLEVHLKTGKPIIGRIIEVVPGRMLVDVQGIQTSLEDFTIGYTRIMTPERKAEEQRLSEEELRELRRNEAYESMRGREMLFRVVAVDYAQHLLKLSQHLYTEEEKQARVTRRETLLRELQPGDVCTGMVMLIGGHVVRVDLGGLVGMIFPHFLARSARLHVDPSMFVYLGQEVQVMVIDIKGQHPSLSIIHVEARDKMFAELRPGAVFDGHIVCLTEQGVYVDIGGPIGKIPAEQVLSGYITHPADLYHRSQKMQVRIEKIAADKRITLSLISVEQ